MKILWVWSSGIHCHGCKLVAIPFHLSIWGGFMRESVGTKVAQNRYNDVTHRKLRTAVFRMVSRLNKSRKLPI